MGRQKRNLLSKKSNYTIINYLGRGAFAQVYKVQSWKDRKYYAMKKVQEFIARDAFLSEIHILKLINSPNVIKIKEYFTTQQTRILYIILELADGGDLRKFIKEGIQNNGIDEKEIWRILIQITQGLKAIHDKNIIHRDIKPENILIFQNQDQNIYKISDFNISKILNNTTASTFAGTPLYMAPEVWNEKKYTKNCDIWSLGCIIYELAALQPPFTSQSRLNLKNEIYSGQYAPIPNKYSQDLELIISQMLQVDPKNRLNSNDILDHYLVRRNNSLHTISNSYPVFPKIQSQTENEEFNSQSNYNFHHKSKTDRKPLKLAQISEIRKQYDNNQFTQQTILNSSNTQDKQQLKNDQKNHNFKLPNQNQIQNKIMLPIPFDQHQQSIQMQNQQDYIKQLQKEQQEQKQKYQNQLNYIQQLEKEQKEQKQKQLNYIKQLEKEQQEQKQNQYNQLNYIKQLEKEQQEQKQNQQNQLNYIKQLEKEQQEQKQKELNQLNYIKQLEKEQQEQKQKQLNYIKQLEKEQKEQKQKQLNYIRQQEEQQQEQQYNQLNYIRQYEEKQKELKKNFKKQLKQIKQKEKELQEQKQKLQNTINQLEEEELQEFKFGKDYIRKVNEILYNLKNTQQELEFVSKKLISTKQQTELLLKKQISIINEITSQRQEVELNTSDNQYQLYPQNQICSCYNYQQKPTYQQIAQVQQYQQQQQCQYYNQKPAYCCLDCSRGQQQRCDNYYQICTYQQQIVPQVQQYQQQPYQNYYIFNNSNVYINY